MEHHLPQSKDIRGILAPFLVLLVPRRRGRTPTGGSCARVGNNHVMCVRIPVNVYSNNARSLGQSSLTIDTASVKSSLRPENLQRRVSTLTIRFSSALDCRT